MPKNFNILNREQGINQELTEFGPDSELFNRVLTNMPKTGIALRGDRISRLMKIRNEGLVDPESNFIVFSPPLNPDLQSKQNMYSQLKDNISFALHFGDPWGEGVREVIKDKDFKDYVDYFSGHPESGFVVSWFTAPTSNPALFRTVEQKGNSWIGPNSTSKSGRVSEFGPLPEECLQDNVISTVGDIADAQNELLKKFLTTKDISTKEFYSKRKFEFLNELTEIMLKKILLSMDSRFKTSV